MEKLSEHDRNAFASFLAVSSRYGLALLSVAVALAVAKLDELVSDQPTFFIFLAAVVFTSWLGGLGPGLLATALSDFVLAYFFLAPVFSWQVIATCGTQLGVFTVLCLSISLVQTSWLRAQRTLVATEYEIRMAHKIQQRLLPVAAPALDAFDIAGTCLPATAVGGDGFDYVTLANGHVGVIVGDVSGHGFSSGFLMAMVHAHLHALGLLQSDAGTILTTANRLLCERIEADRFVTLCLADLDPTNRSLVFAGAGHEAYLLDPSGETRTLTSTGMPLGVYANEVITASAALELADDQIIVMTTDGIIETESPTGRPFGASRLLEVVRANRARSAEEIVTALVDAALQYRGHFPQQDDMTAVVIKVRSAPKR